MWRWNMQNEWRLERLGRCIKTVPPEDQPIAASAERFVELRHRLRLAGLVGQWKLKLVLVLTFVMTVLLMSVFLFRSWWATLIIPGSFLVSIGIIEAETRRRSWGFENDYAPFLISLASSVRSGLDPLDALRQAEFLFPKEGELGQELHCLNQAIERGASEERAVQEFGASIRHPDISLFRAAFILARQQGSPLASCLQRLARVTRQRQSFRRKAKAAIAMQRLSSLGIAACAALVGAFQALTNMAALRQAWTHPAGCIALSGGVLLMIFGLGWMLRLAISRV